MSCTLCTLPLPKNPPASGEKRFCCAGCQTVYQVLEAKQQSDPKKDPLFKEALKVGVVSNKETNRASSPIKETQKIHLEIKNMWCPSCARAIEVILERQRGIISLCVDYATDLAQVTFDPCQLSSFGVVERIAKLGYGATPFSQFDPVKSSKVLLFRFCIAAFLSLNLMMLSIPLYTAFFGQQTDGYESSLGYLSFFLALPLVTYCSFPFWRRFNITLKTGQMGMETLVLIGSLSCFFLSCFSLFTKDPTYLYFDSMGMIITLVLLGKLIEGRAKLSAKQSLFFLFRTLPSKGRVLRKGRLYFVPTKEITSGETLRSLTGEKVVLDGTVLEGSGSVDESVMTGESKPCYKKKGDHLLAGTFLLSGSLTYRAEKKENQTLYSKILEVVERGLTSKTVYLRAVDPLVRVFVPLVLLLALLPFVFDLSFKLALLRSCSVLLISCPCFIAVAAPLAESLLIKRLAKKGALVQNRAALQKLAKTTDIVFDKTGTLTEGKFQILQGMDTLTAHHRAVLKALSSHSNHPLSLAINNGIAEESIPLTFAKEVAGGGLYGVCEGKKYTLGSASFVGVSPLEPKETGIVTSVYFTEEKNLLTQIILGDKLKSDAKKGVSALSPFKVHLFSGDGNRAVQAVAGSCAIPSFNCALDPFEKKEQIDQLKKEGKCVVMIGDGINDAPALTTADVGISVINATDQIARIADIVLTTKKLNVLHEMVALAKKGKKIIGQNLFWAFSYNCVGIVLALFGVLSPLLAALAMTLSSLFVILNTLRLKYYTAS